MYRSGSSFPTGFVTVLESPEMPLAGPGANFTYTWNHGLGRTPWLVSCVLRCKIPEQGHQVGDELQWCTDTDPASLAGNLIASQTSIVYIYSAAGLFQQRGTAYAASSVTQANWRLVFRCLAQ